MALVTEDEIVDIAIRLEENGEAFYTAAAEQTTDAGLRRLFEELATQERQHRRTFQQIGRDGVRLALTPDQWEEFQAYVAALLQQSFFARPDSAINRAASAGDPASALQAALGFEKEAILFYEELQAAVQETSRHVLAQIIQEEKHHLQRLADMLADLAES